MEQASPSTQRTVQSVLTDAPREEIKKSLKTLYSSFHTAYYYTLHQSGLRDAIGFCDEDLGDLDQELRQARTPRGIKAALRNIFIRKFKEQYQSENGVINENTTRLVEQLADAMAPRWNGEVRLSVLAAEGYEYEYGNNEFQYAAGHVLVSVLRFLLDTCEPALKTVFGEEKVALWRVKYGVSYHELGSSTAARRNEMDTFVKCVTEGDMAAVADHIQRIG